MSGGPQKCQARQGAKTTPLPPPSPSPSLEGQGTGTQCTGGEFPAVGSPSGVGSQGSAGLAADEAGEGVGPGPGGEDPKLQQYDIGKMHGKNKADNKGQERMTRSRDRHGEPSPQSLCASAVLCLDAHKIRANGEGW